MCDSSHIFKELDSESQKYWFDFKQKKFLHNIDTFYYSIKMRSNFLRDSEDENVIFFREYFKKQYASMGGFSGTKELLINGVDDILLLRQVTFAKFYNINIELPEMFDIFIADSVPEATGSNGEKLGYSQTCEVIIQIRSYMLWLYGVHECFERSYEVVKRVFEHFNLEYDYAQENRIDYCWHTNYFEKPESFFNIDNLSKMQVSRYKRCRQEFELIGTDSDYEMDYLTFGKRSDKCFLRIYLKSKEVIEQGYKQFFFKIWFFNGLINRYDLYCYEKAFLKRSWRYLDCARLEYYIEFGQDNQLKMQCQTLLAASKYDYTSIRKLADVLTPNVHKIMNIEFQTMRRHSKTYVLFEFERNNKNKAKRIYDYLDNRPLIVEYLTHETFRLVTPEGDSNKSRREYVPFWKCLRNTKLIDCKVSKNQAKLIRNYARSLNKELMKKRVINSAIMFSFYNKGLNNDDVMLDCMDALLSMNDNDLHNARSYKSNKIKQLNVDQLQEVMCLPDGRKSSFKIVDEYGQIYENSIDI